MQLRSSLLLILGFCAFVLPASAQSVLARVKAQGFVSCAAAPRPGLAEESGGGWHGLEIDIARAVAVAVLGSSDKVQFHSCESDQDFADAVKSADILFLSGAEISEHRLASALLPGPVVFLDAQGVMVPASSKIQKLEDLRGHSVCFYIGSASENELNAFSDKAANPVFRRPFSELGEMTDAYTAQNCEALAAEVTDLAEIRNRPETAALQSRILPETLADFPILAATGIQDGAWASIVAWTFYILVSAERQGSQWYPSGAAAMPVDGSAFGLRQDWQNLVLKALGSYGDIFRRNLGLDSPYKLQRGSQVNHLDSGLIPSPYRD